MNFLLVTRIETEIFAFVSFLPFSSPFLSSMYNNRFHEGRDSMFSRAVNS